MDTGTILVDDAGVNIVRPAIKVQQLDATHVLICTFLSGGPTMMTVIQGDTQGFMVYLPN